MYNKTNIFFINTHAKSRGGNNDAYLVFQKRFLIGNLFAAFHLTVIRKCWETIVRQFLRNLVRSLNTGHIDDSGTILLLDQVTKFCIFLIIIFFVDNGIVQIGSGSVRGIQFEINIQLLLEILADITDDLLLGRSGKAGNCNPIFLILFLLQIANKIPDVQIVHTEILTPSRETVSFVDNKANNIPGKKQFFDRVGAQRFRRNVENRG